MLLGLYAWASTVAVPALSADAPALALGFASVALLALLLAWVVAAKWNLAADLLVAAGFIGSSFATWVVVGHSRLTANVAELRTVMGAIGWGLFVVAWVRARAWRHIKPGLPEARNTKLGVKTLGLAGNLHLAVALTLAFFVIWNVGLQNGNGRGVFVTTLALAWVIGALDTSGLLATRLEHQSKGLGLGLFAEPRILLALGLAGVGYFAGPLTP
jgi:hypothetical protein